MTDAGTMPIAFWLLPGEEDARWLRDRIDALAVKHEGPTFDPHVTLHVGRCAPHTDVEAVLGRLARRDPIVALTLAALLTRESEARFKALFFDIATDRLDGAGLLELRRCLVEELLKADTSTPESARDEKEPLPRSALEQALASYEFLPHLSLLYGVLPRPIREGLARQNDVQGRSITFDRVAAVRPAAGFADLSGVERWHVFGHRRLGC